jgi:hypothetical protein
MRRLAVGLLSGLIAATSQAELHGRMPATREGTDYRAWYDDLLDITWAADANLAATYSFGVTDIGSSTSGYGVMNWDTAQTWLAGMNAAAYLGKSDWRLPDVIDTDGPDADTLGGDGCNLAYVGTDCGWNVDPSTGEIAHLYAVTLGNISAYDTSGVHQDWCDTGLPAPPACLTNTGPFTHFFPNHYWTRTSFEPDDTKAWEFNARIGSQNINVKTRYSYLWPVRDGDIGNGIDPPPDGDADGVPDSADNCVLDSNGTQADADEDGYGNACDADLNNSGLTTATDFNLLRECLNLPATASAMCAAADLNDSGLVTSADFGALRSRLNTAPGPSALHP